MKTKIKNIKYLIIGIIIGLSLISAATYAAYTTQAGKIGSLFEKIGSNYKLKGDEIKDNTVDNSEIDNTDEYFMKTLELTGNSSTKGLKMHNGNITGVNQLEINDPGEGFIFKGNTDGDIRINVKDDSHDNMLGITGPSSLKVGIGTTSPGQKLDVRGNIKLNGTIIGEAASDLNLYASDDINLKSRRSRFYNGGTEFARISYNGNWISGNLDVKGGAVKTTCIGNCF